ncbi:MAG TPA: pyridoxal 5'-phosphate synthase glutaminase subunit PdxT [Dehalococcoidia bacterium]|nr:pyridoxal 5'-phosphate synthase glutaminase subunit PdxT [Dehalococcoidia bacterium]
MTTVGVLALQGDFREHILSLRAAGADAIEVRTREELARVDGLIIPGGESTAIARLLLIFELFAPIQQLGRDGFPIWGTCAGAILLANDVSGDLDRDPLALIPISIDRNAYGRQIDSFETDLPAERLNGGREPFHAIFIRAPRIRATGPEIEILLSHQEANADDPDSPEPVAVRYGNLLATTFHPELTNDHRLHAYFIDLCAHHAATTPDTTPTCVTSQAALAERGSL